MSNQRWQDWVTALVGIWVFASPWIIPSIISGTSGLDGIALWNHYLAGAAVIVVALAALYAYQVWEEWVTVVLGLWLAASPWLLGFSGNAAFAASDVLAGAAVAALGGWMAFSAPAHHA
jgi:hypothetical protein